MEEVFIALGSNLGDQSDNLARARDALSAFVQIDACSSELETRPQYVVDQPRFLNMVLRGRTDLTVRALLDRLQRLEKALGRTPTKRFGPRKIDLDILYFGHHVIDEPDLKIPHPRLAERDFVLLPLLEVAPEHRHPVSGKTTREMLKLLESQQ